MHKWNEYYILLCIIAYDTKVDFNLLTSREFAQHREDNSREIACTVTVALFDTLICKIKITLETYG